MKLREELKFRTLTAVIWFIGILVVLMVHKWSIENIHKRLKHIETQLVEKGTAQ